MDDETFVLYLLRETFHKGQSSTVDTQVGKNPFILKMKGNKETFYVSCGYNVDKSTHR